MTARERLPDRRRAETVAIRWPTVDGLRIHVSAGYAEDDRVLEVFLRGGGRVGSERDALLDDLAVILSRLLQHGDDLAAIARGLGRLPGGEPSSVVGAVVDALADLHDR